MPAISSPTAEEEVARQLRSLQIAFRSHGTLEERVRHDVERYVLANAPLVAMSGIPQRPIVFVKDCSGRLIYFESTKTPRAMARLSGASSWYGKLNGEVWPLAAAKELDYLDHAVVNSGRTAQVFVSDPSGQWLVTEFKIEIDPEVPPYIGGVALLVHPAAIAPAVGDDLGRLLDSVPSGVYRMTADGRLLLANASLIRMLGCESFVELIASGEAGPARNAGKLIAAEYDFQSSETIWVRRDGSYIYAREARRSVRDAKGNLLHLEGVVDDLSRLSLEQLPESDQSMVLEAIAADAPLEHVLQSLSQMTERILCGSMCAANLVTAQGLTPKATGTLPADFLDAIGNLPMSGNVCGPALAARFGEPMIAGRIDLHPEWGAYRQSAMRFGLQSCTSIPLLSSTGIVLGTLDVYRKEPYAPDAVEIEFLEKVGKLAAVAIEHQRRTASLKAAPADKDALTGLPSRAAFEQTLEAATIRAKLGNTHLAVFWVDVDRLSQINDTLGHRTGDELLRAIAGRLAEIAPEADAMCRSGGDEFALLLAGLESGDEGRGIATRIVAAFRRPFLIHGHTLIATCSVGIALFPYDGADAVSLLRNADTAMYRAKAWGKNTSERYRSDTAASIRRLHLENDLRCACSNGELELFFQPQVSAGSQITGVEALLRWNHPQLGLLPPNEFLAIAEETGLILDPIGEWVLRRACVQLVEWKKALKRPVRMAVNVSTAQVYRTDLPGMIGQVLADTGLLPGDLEIELTESILMHNLPEAARKVQALRTLGVSIAIDDFGTGYSSLSYLTQLPADAIKIDKSFVNGIETRAGTAMIRAIAALGRDLGLRSVAEGVETEEQFSLVREAGVDQIQGYFIAKPMCASDAGRLLGYTS